MTIESPKVPFVFSDDNLDIENAFWSVDTAYCPPLPKEAPPNLLNFKKVSKPQDKKRSFSYWEYSSFKKFLYANNLGFCNIYILFSIFLITSDVIYIILCDPLLFVINICTINGF